MEKLNTYGSIKMKKLLLLLLCMPLIGMGQDLKVVETNDDDQGVVDENEWEDTEIEEKNDPTKPFISTGEMPVFKDSCDLSMSESEKEMCTQTNILKFIAKNFRYPEIAKANGIEGKVWVEFVIEKDGKVGRVKIVRSLDPYIDKEAIRVLESLPEFEPGKDFGKPAAVKYTVPIQCSLE